jgi:hypothetical protein
MRILGYDYTLRYLPLRENGGSDSAGWVNSAAQVIFVSPEQHQQAQESTVIHEILEAIKLHCEINITHDDLSVLEATLYQVLKDVGMNMSLLTKELTQTKGKK